MNAWDSYQYGFLALMMWREGRGETDDQALLGIGWVAKNRAAKPSWWGGPDLPSVILKHAQFSSFNQGDPNSTKFPAYDVRFAHILELAQALMESTVPDVTGGATSYFDKSMDANPPSWAAKMTKTCEIGSFRFYRA